MMHRRADFKETLLQLSGGEGPAQLNGPLILRRYGQKVQAEKHFFSPFSLWRDNSGGKRIIFKPDCLLSGSREVGNEGGTALSLKVLPYPAPWQKTEGPLGPPQSGPDAYSSWSSRCSEPSSCLCPCQPAAAQAVGRGVCWVSLQQPEVFTIGEEGVFSLPVLGPERWLFRLIPSICGAWRERRVKGPCTRCLHV